MKGIILKPVLVTFCFLIIILIALSCRSEATPKPYGYFRIDLPAREYKVYKSDCNFSFEYPVYGNIVPYQGNNAEPCWMNIEFPDYKGTIYLTYKNMNGGLATYAEDIRTLAYKHILKADDIIEEPFYYPDKKVYGIVYDILGNKVATLVSQEQSAGYYSVVWNAGNFASGIYIYQITAGSHIANKKLLLMK